jgi:hypothetical protein
MGLGALEVMGAGMMCAPTDVASNGVLGNPTLGRRVEVAQFMTS